jgi:hypothetical protein
VVVKSASFKVLRFVSDDVWGSSGKAKLVARIIATFLDRAWDLRNSCKHNGAVLPLSSALVGHGADSVIARA